MHKKAGKLHKVLHILEVIIAILTLIVLVGILAMEIYKLVMDVTQMFKVPDYFVSLDTYLNSILTIVVGLEFVRMLIDMTPANTIEVLIVAIARHVILDYNNPLSNLACVACIAGLFATRHFLITKKELKTEMSEVE